MLSTKHIDKLIDELESRLTKLKALREAIDDKEIAEVLSKSFATNDVAPSAPKPRTRQKRSGNMEKLLRFFEKRDNEWATLSEMVEDVKKPKNSLRQLVYRSHVEQFERQSFKGGGRESLFRLKKSTS